MSMLYLPNSKAAIVAERIQSIVETTVEEKDPTQKSGKRNIPGVEVTLIDAPMIEEESDGEADSVPYYDTYVGADVAVLLAWRNSQIIQAAATGELAPSGAPIVVQLPLPAGMKYALQSSEEE